MKVMLSHAVSSMLTTSIKFKSSQSNQKDPCFNVTLQQGATSTVRATPKTLYTKND